MSSAKNTSGLEFLLLSQCLMPGIKVFRESNTSISVQPAPDETVLFFAPMIRQKILIAKMADSVSFYGERRMNTISAI